VWKIKVNLLQKSTLNNYKFRCCELRCDNHPFKMLTTLFSDHLNWLLQQKTGSDSTIRSIKSIAGGSINNAYKLETSSGNYFLKVNSASRFPGMFEAEENGLDLLRKTNGVDVPKTICVGEFENTSYLILEFISPGKRNKNYFQKLGNDIAALHQNQSKYFGLNYANYIGSLNQSNQLSKSGVDFMINERFEPLIKAAFKKGLLDNSHLHLAETFYKRLPDFLPVEAPSLLHGDLWNGNIITGNSGSAMLIDPAVYYGYRETDLSMAKLFGGFDEQFFNSYIETFPLADGWEDRVELFQMYPLLVHLNLFGISYRGSVIEILKRHQ